MKEIETYLYTGFLDAGKTTYIQDNLFHDYFYKHGSTLILSFEEGETSYDEEALSKRRCSVSCYQGSEDIAVFCLNEIRRFEPDRVIIEDNVMIPDLPESLPGILSIRAKTALISGETLPVYFTNMRSYFTRILKDARLVLFNRTENKDDLLAYSTPFRLINPGAAYLWESPMGYHEKAFGIPLSYDRSKSELQIGEEDYASFYLDSLEHPRAYQGKTVELTVQILEAPLPDDSFVFGGRKVFTCCFADIQNLGFYIRNGEPFSLERYGWYRITAAAFFSMIFRRERLCLKVLAVERVGAPAQELIGYPSGK